MVTVAPKTAVGSFRDMRVWQTGMQLVETVYRLTQDFPRSETYGLTNQMRRAAVSVPSNIAEGHVREHLKEYLHHISFAQGSLAELQTQAEIAVRLHYLSQEQSDEIRAAAEALAKQLYSLRNALGAKVKAAAVVVPTPNN